MCEVCEIINDTLARSEIFQNGHGNMPENVKPAHETEPDMEKPCEDGCPSVERAVQIQRDKEKEQKKSKVSSLQKTRF